MSRHRIWKKFNMSPVKFYQRKRDMRVINVFSNHVSHTVYMTALYFFCQMWGTYTQQYCTVVSKVQEGNLTCLLALQSSINIKKTCQPMIPDILAYFFKAKYFLTQASCDIFLELRQKSLTKTKSIFVKIVQPPAGFESISSVNKIMRRDQCFVQP